MAHSLQTNLQSLFMKNICKRMVSTFKVAATLGVMALIFTGCAGFNKDFKMATAAPWPPNDINGAWEGTWKSDANGHAGKLRCIITQTGPTNYNARFKATYKKVFKSEYDVPLVVQQEDRSYKFSGSADLGALAGGEYTYKGAANPAKFFSTYDSKHDHGTFQMERPDRF
ncbi:MAG: hypothetical protein ACO1QB_17210 [Verrucomicrobiales bacterium]